jgi:hypothetical protein
MVLISAGRTAIGAGGSHSHAVANGQVLSWGWNSAGELGDGTQTTRSSPTLLSTLGGVQAIAGGTFHTLALMNDGTVQAWGDPGAIGLSCPGNACLTPSPVAGLSGIYGISADMAVNLPVTGQRIRTMCIVCSSVPVIGPGRLRPLPATCVTADVGRTFDRAHCIYFGNTCLTFVIKAASAGVRMGG